MTRSSSPRVLLSAPVTSGGLHAHLRNVLPRLTALRPAWRFELHAPEQLLRTVFGRIDEPWMRPHSAGGRGRRLRWEFVELPRLLRADPDALLVAPCGPFWNVRLARRAVVRFDNLLVLLTPRERVVGKADHRRLRILRHVYLANAKAALRPVCASRHSRARYAALTGLPAEHFAVIPHGIDPEAIARARPSPRIAELCARPFVLTIGQATPYRCTRELIGAYRLLVERDPRALPPLVWAGSARREDLAYERECLELLEPLERAGHAIHLGQIGYEDVYALDRSALLFVHPSVHEDCPNTVFEAVAAGTPVICADIPANREFVGDAVHFLPSCTPEAIAAAIAALLADPARRETLREKGRRSARALSWDETARLLVVTMEQALAARSGSG